MKSKKLKDKRNATNEPIRARLTEDLKLFKSTPSKTEPSRLFQRVAQLGQKTSYTGQFYNEEPPEPYRASQLFAV